MFESPYSSNVILAKARAMYGNKLRANNFQDLLNCHSVSEVAAYLKNHTRYASVLKDINESTIHRGHLEHLLRRKLEYDLISLGRYDINVGMHLSDYFIQRSEIEQIISCLRLMNAGRVGDFFFEMPSLVAFHSHLDPLKMSRSKSYEELLHTMEHTPYYDILSKFEPREDGSVRLTEIENALYTKLTQTVFTIISHTRSAVKKELSNLYGTQVDVQNVTRILRMKKYFNAAPDFIRTNLLPSGGILSEKTIDNMLNATTADQVMELFWPPPLGATFPNRKGLLPTIYRTEYRTIPPESISITPFIRVSSCSPT
jgi:V/A-type H+-transporting ATPase subunit C